MELIKIPKLIDDHERIPNKPGWINIVNSRYEPQKPVIRCNCGELCGIGLHYVHSDGKITASFLYFSVNQPHEKPSGCGWHVFLELEDWIGLDFPPEK